MSILIKLPSFENLGTGNKIHRLFSVFAVCKHVEHIFAYDTAFKV